MTVTKLIQRLQKLKDKGLPAGHSIDADDDVITILGPVIKMHGGRQILHEIKLKP